MEHLKPNSANSPPLTPLTFIDRAATVYGDCPSIVYGPTVYTWSDTHRRCLQVASFLSSNGIGRGHVVSVLAPNIPAAYELHFAVPMCGAILSNINTRLDPRIVSVILRHSESKLIFVDILSLSLLGQAISLLPQSHPSPRVILIQDGEVGNDQITLDVEVHDTYEEIIVKKGDTEYEWIRPESDVDPIVLNYTSGTTSSPKGVVHCHRGIFLMTLNSLLDWWVPERPVYLWTLPMFHANGWGYTWGMAAVGGVSICLRRFDADVIYNAITRHHVTHMCGAPVVLNMLSNHPNPPPLPAPVNVLTAGAPPPAAVLHRAESLGFVVSHGYGLTETGGLIVSCAWKPKWNTFPAQDRARLKARQGVRSIVATQIDVIDPDSGRAVPWDGQTIGEVVLRSAFIMLGYYKDPQGTSNCMRNDGWFRTGDVAVMHKDGYIEIKDRSKDIIISGGENISSVEVESVLYTCPSVNEAAVVARPDEYWGETPCAYVSLKEGQDASDKDIIQYCREKLPHYMVPRTVVVLQTELPKTSTGKVQKYVLREMAKGLGPSKGNKSSRL